MAIGGRVPGLRAGREGGRCGEGVPGPQTGEGSTGGRGVLAVGRVSVLLDGGVSQDHSGEGERRRSLSGENRRTSHCGSRDNNLQLEFSVPCFVEEPSLHFPKIQKIDRDIVFTMCDP